MAKKKSAGCEYCSNYVYDEDYHKSMLVNSKVTNE